MFANLRKNPVGLLAKKRWSHSNECKHRNTLVSVAVLDGPTRRFSLCRGGVLGSTISYERPGQNYTKLTIATVHGVASFSKNMSRPYSTRPDSSKENGDAKASDQKTLKPNNDSLEIEKEISSHNHDEANHSHSHDNSAHSHSHSLFSHSHSHSVHDNILIQETGGLKNPAIRITWIGLLVNLGMAVGKGVGGVVFHSQALLADAVHALSDLVSDFLTLATVSIGTRPANSRFPYGYGKFETLGSLGVSSLLIMAGVSVGWSGLGTIIENVFGNVPYLTTIMGHGGHIHNHGAVGQETDLNAAWLALASIFVKEWLYKATMKIAKKTGSTVLVANAWHHRIDSMTSIVAVATIGAGYLFGVTWFDALGGLIVSSVIVRAGFKNIRSAIVELADGTTTVDQDIVNNQKIKIQSLLEQAVAEKATDSNFSLNNLALMPSGPNYTFYIELAASQSIPSQTSTDLRNFSRMSSYLQKRLLESDKALRKVTISLVEQNRDHQQDSPNGEDHNDDKHEHQH